LRFRPGGEGSGGRGGPAVSSRPGGDGLGGIFRSSSDPFRPSPSPGNARRGYPAPAPHLGPHPAYAAAGSARPAVVGSGRSGSYAPRPGSAAAADAGCFIDAGLGEKRDATEAGGLLRFGADDPAAPAPDAAWAAADSAESAAAGESDGAPRATEAAAAEDAGGGGRSGESAFGGPFLLLSSVPPSAASPPPSTPSPPSAP